MKLPTIFFLCLVFTNVVAKEGKISGGQAYTIPSWFKISLLDLNEDSKEAGQTKHLMLFMHLKACPYCARMLDENFRSGTNKIYIKKHFDVIAINIRGDKEVTWHNNQTLTEEQLAKKIGVYATPTIVFLNAKAQKILQLNGYRKPESFHDVLRYIHRRHYKKMSLAEFVQQQKRKRRYGFLPHPAIKPYRNLAGYQKPLAVLFENKDCNDCKEFYEKVLYHASVRKELNKYLVIRLDTYSKTRIRTPSGELLSPAEWAKQLGLNYHPGLALFDKAKRITVVNGRLYHFHFKETLRYVSGGHYTKYPTFSKYLKQRQSDLLKAGINIDLSE